MNTYLIFFLSIFLVQGAYCDDEEPQSWWGRVKGVFYSTKVQDEIVQPACTGMAALSVSVPAALACDALGFRNTYMVCEWGAMLVSKFFNEKVNNTAKMTQLLNSQSVVFFTSLGVSTLITMVDPTGFSLPVRFLWSAVIGVPVMRQ